MQATIGFGTRATGICWSTAVIMTVQNISGMILDGVWVGIVFAKVSLSENFAARLHLQQRHCCDAARTLRPQRVAGHSHSTTASF